jgi:glycosyltransferase involved in cell wall biosynthesis
MSAAARKKLSCVLITPARNEEEHIEKTLTSVIGQTRRPARWVIVSDGSTDTTDAIAARYAAVHDWIEFIRMPERRDRQFAAKVQCFKAGYARVAARSFDVIGNLDADISFDADYLGFLMDKFSSMPGLGVAGTPFIEEGYSSSTDSYEGERHVAGGCQLFRRACFEQIGGYVPNPAGGIDWIAVTTARMLGWQTRSFPEKHFYHHRGLGTAESSSLASAFNYGRKDYYLGNHPVWEAFRVAYRMTRRPYLLNGGALLAGYLWAAVSGMERAVTRELMAFHRQEEMEKLRAILAGMLRQRAAALRSLLG